MKKYKRGRRRAREKPEQRKIAKTEQAVPKSQKEIAKVRRELPKMQRGQIRLPETEQVIRKIAKRAITKSCRWKALKRCLCLVIQKSSWQSSTV